MNLFSSDSLSCMATHQVTRLYKINILLLNPVTTFTMHALMNYVFYLLSTALDPFDINLYEVI